MSDLEMWNAIIGFLAPIIVSFVVAVAWLNWQKIATSVVTCLVAGGVSSYLAGSLTANYAHSILIIFFAAMGSYVAFWKPLGLNGRQSTPAPTPLFPPTVNGPQSVAPPKPPAA